MLIFIVLVIPINKGDFAEIYNIVLLLEMFKVGVASPGRVDTWGVTLLDASCSRSFTRMKEEAK
jgi:hypothetical protein